MRWHPQTIGEVIAEELTRFGPAGAIADVVRVWRDAVGPAIAENAWPARIGRDGTLTVATSSSVWAFELTQLEAEIRARLGEHLGGSIPARLRFAAGRLPARGRDDAVPDVEKVPPPADDAARREAAEIAAPIENEELRRLVARAAAASLARRAGPV